MFLVKYLDYICSLSYVEIFHLLQRWEGVEIHCRLIPNWIKSTTDLIWLPDQYIIKLEILLGEVSLKYHRVIRKPASLYLYCLIETSFSVFSPRVSPRPYNPISQTSLTQITWRTNLIRHNFTRPSYVGIFTLVSDFLCIYHSMLTRKNAYSWNIWTTHTYT